MRIAALDLGSNSFHLLVADVHVDGTFSMVAREKEMLRLGDEVAQFGTIRPATADRAVESVRRLRQLADALGTTEIIAKATSAIRTAANGSELVDRIEEDTGVDVEVIDGEEEARLIFGAVRASVVIDPAPALCIDIGGGSVEVMIGDAAGLRWKTSIPLGVGRLTAECVEDDPPSKADRKRLEEHIYRGIEPLVEQVRSRAPKMAVGTSGTLNDLVRMAVALASGDDELPSSTNALRATRAELEALHERILRAKSSERRRMPGLEEQRRAELLPAGSMLLVTMLNVFDLDALTVSDWALREGIVLDAVRTHDPDDWSDDPRALRRAAVSGLARRCRSDELHTEHVARLALRLFDETEPFITSMGATAKCSSSRRCSTTSASTSRARDTTGMLRISSRTASCAASSRMRSRSSPRSYVTTGAATPRCPSRVSARSMTKSASVSASWPRCCGLPTVSTAAGAVSWTTCRSNSAPISLLCDSPRATTSS